MKIDPHHNHLIQEISSRSIATQDYGSISQPIIHRQIDIISLPDDILALHQHIRQAEQERLRSITKRYAQDIDVLGGHQLSKDLKTDTLVVASSISDVNHPTIHNLKVFTHFDEIQEWAEHIHPSHRQLVISLGPLYSELQSTKILLETLASRQHTARIVITGDYATQSPELLLKELRIGELQSRAPQLEVVCLRGEPLSGRIESIFTADNQHLSSQEGVAHITKERELRIQPVPRYNQSEFDRLFIPLAERYQTPQLIHGSGFQLAQVNQQQRTQVIPFVHSEGGQRCSHHACTFCIQYGLGDYIHLSSKQMLHLVSQYRESYQRHGISTNMMAVMFYSSVNSYLRSPDEFRDHIRQVQEFTRDSGTRLLWYGIGTLEQVNNIPDNLWREAVMSGLTCIDWGLETQDRRWRKALGKGTELIEASQVVAKMGELCSFARKQPGLHFLNDEPTIHSKAFLMIPPDLRDNNAKRRLRDDLSLIRRYPDLHYDVSQLFPATPSPLSKEIHERGTSLFGMSQWTELNINIRSLNSGDTLKMGVDSTVDNLIDLQHRFQEMMKLLGNEGYRNWRSIEGSMNTFYRNRERL